MTTSDPYPSVTIVAGGIATARPTSETYGALLRMHDGQIYITITKEVAKQWLPVISEIANEGINE